MYVEYWFVNHVVTQMYVNLTWIALGTSEWLNDMHQALKWPSCTNEQCWWVVKKINVNSVCGCLHHADMSDVANILEVHATSIFRFEVWRVDEFLCVYRLILQKTTRGKSGVWCLISASRIVACIFQMLATSPTCTHCNHPRTELTAVEPLWKPKVSRRVNVIEISLCCMPLNISVFWYISCGDSR
jgi:hypothetical protein